MYENIVVIGNGKTSRENVEALIDDYIYANKEVVFHLISSDKQSEGQVWAKQYLTDKKITVEVGNSLKVYENAAFFILWDDEDDESVNALANAKEQGIPAFDLTNGLVEISPSETIEKIERPRPHVAEIIDKVVKDNNKLFEKLSDSDEEAEDDVYEDPLYEGIRIIASIFAEEFAKVLKK